jgi:hypothetical protein
MRKSGNLKLYCSDPSNFAFVDENLILQLQKYFPDLKIAEDADLDFLVALTIIVCINSDSNKYIGLLMNLE